jgi:hypothetical protein
MTTPSSVLDLLLALFCTDRPNRYLSINIADRNSVHMRSVNNTHKIYIVLKSSSPVFWILGHLLGVKRRKSLRTTFFQLRGLESYWEIFFLSQQLILFVREIIIIVQDDELCTGLVMRIHFRICIAFANWAKTIASLRINRSLIRLFAFASLIRVFAFESLNCTLFWFDKYSASSINEDTRQQRTRQRSGQYQLLRSRASVCEWVL